MKKILMVGALVFGLLGASVLLWASSSDKTTTVGNAAYDVVYYDEADVWLEKDLDGGYIDTSRVYTIWHYEHAISQFNTHTDGDGDSASAVIRFYTRTSPKSAWVLVDTASFDGQADTLSMVKYWDFSGGPGADSSGVIHYDNVAGSIFGMKEGQIRIATYNADNCSCYVENVRHIFKK